MGRARADSGDILEPRLDGAFGTALPMKAHSEAVRFITNLLDQMKNWRVAFQPNGLILLAKYVDNLLLFRDARDGLVDDFQLFKSRARRVELPDSAIDQNQAGEGFRFFL